MNGNKELKIIGYDIVGLTQTLNTLEAKVSFLRDSAIFNDVKLSDEQSFLVALHYKNKLDILIKLLNTEIDIIMELMENLNLEKNNMNKKSNFSLNKIVSGKLFSDFYKLKKQKNQFKSRTKALEKELIFKLMKIYTI